MVRVPLLARPAVLQNIAARAPNEQDGCFWTITNQNIQGRLHRSRLMIVAA
jgi:hypothetical protein